MLKIGAMSHKYLLFGDGGSRGNPGPAACGWAIFRAEDVNLNTGIEINPPLTAGHKYLGVTTNNQAEYSSLVFGFEALFKLINESKTKFDPSQTEIVVLMDSQLVIRQMLGQYKVKDVGLKLRWAEAQAAATKLSALGYKLSYTSIPRTLNAYADNLVNTCLDQQA